MRNLKNHRFHVVVSLTLCICYGAATTTITKGYTYVGGKGKDLPFSSPSPAASPGMSSAATSHNPASFYEPRGDYGGGGYGGGGGGWGGGGGGGGASGVYHYSVHQPHQPYYHAAPMGWGGYDEGFDGGEFKGLIGLLGLTGLKGLLGLLGLAKLLLPLLGLLLPLLLPLFLLKALALLALILLIPVPVISTGGGRKLPTTLEEGKAYLKDTMTEILSKIPSDINQIVSKIKDSSASTELLKTKEGKPNSKQVSGKSTGHSVDKAL